MFQQDKDLMTEVFLKILKNKLKELENLTPL